MTVMPERRQVRRGNRTEQLQIRYRNFRWRDRDGNPILASTYREIDKRTKALVDRVLELSAEGKSAAEIRKELRSPRPL